MSNSEMCLFHLLKFYITSFIFISSFLCTSHSLNSDFLSCFQKGSCNCSNNKGDTIDLSPLMDIGPLTASSRSYLFMYYPCEDLPLISLNKTNCTNKFGICRFVPLKPTEKPVEYKDVITNKVLGNFTKLATNKEAVIRENNLNQIEIVFKHIVDDIAITTLIKLHCDETKHEYILTVDKSTIWENVLTLSTQYACFKVSPHMSGFAVFFLILTIVAAIYFIGGILVLKFIRGATGLEMIPNHEFWCHLVGLIKNGFNQLKSCGKNRPDTYDSI